MEYSLINYIGYDKKCFLDANYFAIIEVVIKEFERHGICLEAYRKANPPPQSETFDGMAFLKSCYMSLPEFVSNKVTLMDFVFHVVFNQKIYLLNFGSEFFDILHYETEKFVRGISKH
jgi:hypothetical protein